MIRCYSADTNSTPLPLERGRGWVLGRCLSNTHLLKLLVYKGLLSDFRWVLGVFA